ncbi:MAG: hypothetical protein K8W52_21060 [Deltaproteobacteria bacterium]|nr:hypothetical protein [Deltaproteobacteria bacterium]
MHHAKLLGLLIVVGCSSKGADPAPSPSTTTATDAAAPDPAIVGGAAVIMDASLAPDASLGGASATNHQQPRRHRASDPRYDRAMRVHLLGLLTVLAMGCDGGTAIPTAAELYGTWHATADGVTRDFVFAATDAGAHAELAGLTDIYLLSNGGAVVQTGQYSVGTHVVTGYGTTDALVTQVVSGSGAGNTYGNAILDWTGASLTISSESASAGQLVFTR